MKSFDEWKEEQERTHNDYDAENAWYAGQQSKQAEVDELKREVLNKTNEAYADGQRSMRKMIKSNEDELQKRIDEINKLVDLWREDYVTLVKYDDGNRYCLEDCINGVVNILKGDQS